MTRHRLTCALLLTIPLYGFTDCEHFADTPIPTTDTTTPVAGARVMQPDGTDEIRFYSAHYDTHDHGETFAVFPFGYDRSGVRSLRVQQSATARCESGNLGTIRHFNIPTLTDEITGSPGQVVSNGRYLVLSFDASRYGARTCDVSWSWIATATDFHGHVATASGGVHYSP